MHFLWFLYSLSWPADAGYEPTQILLVVVAVDSQGSSGRKPPLAFADCAGLPADAGGCDGGDGEGVVLLSPAHSTAATDEHVLRQKLECGGTEIPSFTISFLCDHQEVT